MPKTPLKNYKSAVIASSVLEPVITIIDGMVDSAACKCQLHVQELREIAESEVIPCDTDHVCQRSCSSSTYDCTPVAFGRSVLDAGSTNPVWPHTCTHQKVVSGVENTA